MSKKVEVACPICSAKLKVNLGKSKTAEKLCANCGTKSTVNINGKIIASSARSA